MSAITRNGYPMVALLLLSAVLLAGCAGGAQPIQTQIVTVPVTVPVEVTRLVEIMQTIEVTSEVIVTVVVAPKRVRRLLRQHPPSASLPTLRPLPCRASPSPKSKDSHG